MSTFTKFGLVLLAILAAWVVSPRVLAFRYRGEVSEERAKIDLWTVRTLTLERERTAKAKKLEAYYARLAEEAKRGANSLRFDEALGGHQLTWRCYQPEACGCRYRAHLSPR